VDVVARAARNGLAIEGLNAYTADGHRHRPALVVGYATPPAHAFTAALARLCTVLSTPS
jgi:GntR family transcriptional regulator/MocR family aminotransferase